ncbi:MAG: lipoprotein localization factor LolB, partial [Anaerolineae bacterium]|nr:lipoprotein localization factor LolB [Anaerolineae bacterium]
MRQLWALMLFLLLAGCMSLPTADPTPAVPTAV